MASSTTVLWRKIPCCSFHQKVLNQFSKRLFCRQTVNSQREQDGREGGNIRWDRRNRDELGEETQKPRPRSPKSEFAEFKLEGLTPRKFEMQFKAFERHEKAKLQPRFHKMPTDQDWTKVWPTARSFNPTVVPLPLRQGLVDNQEENKGIKPDKFVNEELLKIPNFLHLTPPHIWKHCEHLKHLLTPWPEGLNEDNCREHFPLEIIESDYCFASASIRDPRARKVTLVVKLEDLELNEHAKDKFLRLVGDRYSEKTGNVTIICDRCPTKQQNYEYAKYLLTAVYFESWTEEPWEDDKEPEDYRQHQWHLTESKQKTLELTKKLGSINKESEFHEKDETAILETKTVKEYSQSVSKIHTEGDSEQNLADYKQSVLNLLNLKTTSNKKEGLS